MSALKKFTKNTAKETELRERLFQLSVRHRRVHDHPLVIRPEAPEPLSPEILFPGSEGRRVLELGSGWGEFCLEWLEAHPLDQYIAFEIKSERIKNLLSRADKLGIDRLRIIPVNFNWFLEDFLPPGLFDYMIVNFPDPWPKKRHWKHRLVQDDFPTRAARLLRVGGQIALATDHGPYARKILSVFRKSPQFEAAYPHPHYLRVRPADLPSTRFEKTHLQAGLRPYYQRWLLGTEL